MTAVIIAAVIGLAILFGTIATVRALAMGPPPEPDPDAVQEVEVYYRCSVCGMQVTVTHLQDAASDPPRHCREDMDPVLA
ncbi:MAG: hypothetical protein IIC70_06990 [Acidobacteria bacterium]|nr:hypothetical protein [Acidobacteriota bacterium]MCH8129629.1 hypothetical protein [Acidobacteriota bacterium]MCH8900515.1 hypothetical protein [Acidobacteriota bacterium]